MRDASDTCADIELHDLVLRTYAHPLCGESDMCDPNQITADIFALGVPFSMTTVMKTRKHTFLKRALHLSTVPAEVQQSGAHDASPLYYRMFHRAV